MGDQVSSRPPPATTTRERRLQPECGGETWEPARTIARGRADTGDAGTLERNGPGASSYYGARVLKGPRTREGFFAFQCARTAGLQLLWAAQRGLVCCAATLPTSTCSGLCSRGNDAGRAISGQTHPGGGKGRTITRAQGCGASRTCIALAPGDTLDSPPGWWLVEVVVGFSRPGSIRAVAHADEAAMASMHVCGGRRRLGDY
jgi:hypothetical protein